MPELPEVETIRLGLQKHLVGHTIVDVELIWPGQFHGDPKSIIGSKIIGIRRFGKGLVIDLDNGLSLAVHVKMTGQLIYKASPFLAGTHTRLIFHLDNEALLLFNDIRKFGWLKVLKTSEVTGLSFFKSLGPEPLKNLTLENFTQIVKKGSLPIKSLLMDQKRIAGIGNIYANDALFLAKIAPARIASSLSNQEIKKLFKSIEEVLTKSLKAGGASEVNFLNALGEKGTYQKHFLVYKKNGKPCTNCGTIIKKMRIGGRGTFYCPSCQS